MASLVKSIAHLAFFPSVGGMLQALHHQLRFYNIAWVAIFLVATFQGFAASDEWSDRNIADHLQHSNVRTCSESKYLMLGLGLSSYPSTAQRHLLPQRRYHSQQNLLNSHEDMLSNFFGNSLFEAQESIFKRLVSVSGKACILNAATQDQNVRSKFATCPGQSSLDSVLHIPWAFVVHNGHNGELCHHTLPSLMESVSNWLGHLGGQSNMSIVSGLPSTLATRAWQQQNERTIKRTDAAYSGKCLTVLLLAPEHKLQPAFAAAMDEGLRQRRASSDGVKLRGNMSAKRRLMARKMWAQRHSESQGLRFVVHLTSLEAIDSCFFKSALRHSTGTCTFWSKSNSTAANSHRRRGLIKVTVKCGNQVSALGVAVELAHLPFVYFVGEEQVFTLKNHWAKSIVQAGDVDGSISEFSKQGLSGEGQLVAISDSGVDTNLCYFWDPEESVPFNKQSSTHRKFQSYIVPDSKENDQWDFDGHGTHTTGTIAGHAFLSSQGPISTEISNFNGMAPSARLVFTDIGKYGGLFPPDDLNEGLFPEPYGMGAHIRSDSWGTTSIYYTSAAQEVDSFAYQHDSFLSFWAAGNDGADGVMTVGSPATCKNCIAVGAVENSYRAFEANGNVDVTISFETSPGSGTSCSPSKSSYTASMAQFSPIPQDDLVHYAELAAPELACNSLETQFGGKIALVVRGTCDFSFKALKAQAAGASAVVIINTDDTRITPAGDAPGLNIPVTLVAKSFGDIAKECIAAGTPVYLKFHVDHLSSSSRGPSRLASFSSLGPTGDGRIKPDLVAPGDPILSAGKFKIGAGEEGKCYARGSSKSTVKSMSGTSMASPVLAGNAVLLRQWFSQGRYPDGVPKQLDQVHPHPSGAMLKAVLMVSATPPDGKMADSHFKLSTSTPNIFSGYGLPSLQNAVPLPSTSSSFIQSLGSVHGVDRKVISIGHWHKYSFSLPELTLGQGVGFKAALVWWDPPGSELSSQILVNDLDLILQYPNGEFLYGNHHFTSGHLGVSYSLHDNSNNNELVHLPAHSAGLYSLWVHYATGSTEQKYSLWMRGKMSSLAFTDQSHPPGHCKGTEGINQQADAVDCKCLSRGLAGRMCQIPLQMLHAGQNLESVSLQSMRWQYYWFIIPHAATSFNVTVQRSAKSPLAGDPDFYLRKEKLPSLHASDVKNDDCESCGETGDKVLRPKSGQTAAGVWYVGIYAYCCVDTSFDIRLSIMSPSCPHGNLDCKGNCSGGFQFDRDGKCCAWPANTCSTPKSPISPSTIPLTTASPPGSQAVVEQPEEQPPDPQPPQQKESKISTRRAVVITVGIYLFQGFISVIVWALKLGQSKVRRRDQCFLWLMAGVAGAHRSYARQPWHAICMFFSAGGVLLWWMHDGVQLFCRRRSIRTRQPQVVQKPSVWRQIRLRLRSRRDRVSTHGFIDLFKSAKRPRTGSRRLRLRNRSKLKKGFEELNEEDAFPTSPSHTTSLDLVACNNEGEAGLFSISEEYDEETLASSAVTATLK